MLAPRQATAAPSGENSFYRTAEASYESWVLGRNVQALALAAAVLEAPEADQGARVQAMKTMVLANLSDGDAETARKALLAMLEIDPSARFSPESDYPKPVFDLYYQVVDSLGTGTMDMNTIAIGDFENNSIHAWKKKYSVESIRSVLLHAITNDLCGATRLQVVDRQRTERILQEIDFDRSGAVDPRKAVKAGSLLGAQAFVFGSYSLLSDDEIRIDLRVDHTATGRIVLCRSLTAKFSGKPKDFFELERALVVSIAGAVDSIAGDFAVGGKSRRAQVEEYLKSQEAALKGRKYYAESKFLVGEAMEREQAGDLSSALEVWNEALRLDPRNVAAARRVSILKALVEDPQDGETRTIQPVSRKES
jgi:tetratricopeptide (TPR) repeat protein